MWVARYEWVGVNITAIGGARGLVVVVTHGSTAAGRDVAANLRRPGAGRVAHVVNSHWHWDHTFGNAAFRASDRDVPIHAHEEAARWLAARGEQKKRRLAEMPDEPHAEEVGATEIVVPDTRFLQSQVLDLGDRGLELAYVGRGHTGRWSTPGSSARTVTSSPRSPDRAHARRPGRAGRSFSGRGGLALGGGRTHPQRRHPRLGARGGTLNACGAGEPSVGPLRADEGRRRAPAVTGGNGLTFKPSRGASLRAGSGRSNRPGPGGRRSARRERRAPRG